MQIFIAVTNFQRGLSVIDNQPSLICVLDLANAVARKFSPGKPQKITFIGPKTELNQLKSSDFLNEYSKSVTTADGNTDLPAAFHFFSSTNKFGSPLFTEVKQLASEESILLLDALQPLVTLSDVNQVLFDDNSSALSAQAVTDSVKRSHDLVNIDRDSLFSVSTPAYFAASEVEPSRAGFNAVVNPASSLARIDSDLNLLRVRTG